MKKYIIGNLKMNLLSLNECNRYLADFDNNSKKIKLKNSEIILCPPHIYLENFIQYFKKKKNIKIGAQDLFWEEKGSFTGEISPLMLKNIGAEYVIIGHSERRRYFGETNETANLKIKAALKAGIAPIYCIGETREERRMNLTKDVLIHQIQEGLKDVTKVNLEKIIIAYEPVWAISSNNTGLLPSSDDIMEARLLIRKILTEKYGSKYASAVSIIYGGSVDVQSSGEVCVEPEMDGVLVGKESLNPAEFLKIAKIINK